MIKYKSWIIVCLSGIVLFAVGCGKKFYIPEYDTAQDQYLYALRIKSNPYKSLAPDKRQATQKQAIEALKLVIKRFPDDETFTPLAYLSLADSYYRLNRHKKAIKVYETARKKYPDQDDIQAVSVFGQARAYERLKRFARANSLYKECIDRFSEDERQEIQDIVRRCRFYYQRVKTK